MRSLLVVTLRKAGDPELRWSGPSTEEGRGVDKERTGQASGSAGQRASAREPSLCWRESS